MPRFGGSGEPGPDQTRGTDRRLLYHLPYTDPAGDPLRRPTQSVSVSDPGAGRRTHRLEIRGWTSVTGDSGHEGGRHLLGEEQACLPRRVDHRLHVLIQRATIRRIGKISLHLIEPGSPPLHEVEDLVTKADAVVDVAHILSGPKAVYSKSDSVDVVRRRMDHAQSDYAIGLGDEGQYLGIIGRAQLDIPSSNTPAELLDNTGRAIIPVGSSTTLQEALHLLSDNDLPLPVVDESNAFIGVVTQRDLLKMLASDI